MARYIQPGESFIPAESNPDNVVTVDPDNPEHRAIFGEGLCDAIKEAQARGIKRNSYVQMVTPKTERNVLAVGAASTPADVRAAAVRLCETFFDGAVFRDGNPRDWPQMLANEIKCLGVEWDAAEQCFVDLLTGEKWC